MVTLSLLAALPGCAGTSELSLPWYTRANAMIIAVLEDHGGFERLAKLTALEPTVASVEISNNEDLSLNVWALLYTHTLAELQLRPGPIDLLDSQAAGPSARPLPAPDAFMIVRVLPTSDPSKLRFVQVQSFPDHVFDVFLRE